MRNRLFIRWMRVSILVAFTMMLIPALAMADGKDDYGKKGREKKVAGFRLESRFRDMDDAPWAGKFILSAQVNQIIMGYDDNTFRPNIPVNREQAVLMAVRALGLADEAASIAQSVYAGLPYSDASKVSPWARSAVKLAIDKGWIDQKDGDFEPHRPASRVWTVRLLVNAMGLGEKAKARSGEQLTFTDAANLSASDAGYVAVAIDSGFIKGFENNTFRPNGPVTRAQMAKMLDMVKDSLQDSQQITVENKDYVVTGVVASVYGQDIRVLNGRGIKVTIPVTSTTPVFINDSQGVLADLKPGFLVRVYLNESKEAVLIDARSAREALPVVGKLFFKEVKGTVVAVDPSAMTITVNAGFRWCIKAPCPQPEESLTLKVAEDAGIKIEDFGYGTLADIQPGDRVELKVRGDTVVKVEVKSPEVRDKVKQKERFRKWKEAWFPGATDGSLGDYGIDDEDNGDDD